MKRYYLQIKNARTRDKFETYEEADKVRRQLHEILGGDLVEIKEVNKDERTN